MEYDKSPLSFQDQADLLIQRGLIADRDFLIFCLSEVNYYRLSGYWYSFRDEQSDNLKPGTKFETIWDRYVFDRQLRLLVMDAIERVEVSVGTKLTNTFVLKYGALGHLERNNFHNMDIKTHRRFLYKLQSEDQRSSEVFVKKYFSKYTLESDLPLWMAIELMPFGGLYTFYKYVEQYMQRDVAQSYGLHAKVLESWLRTLNNIRNICAHHSRLWNRILVKPVMFPDKKHSPEFFDPIVVNPERLFAVLTILKYMVDRIAPQSGWQKRLEHLIEVKHPYIPIKQMGFPDNWKECPVWKER